MGFVFAMLMYCALFLLTIAAIWAVYAKAGQPGWAAVIPIYNLYVLTRIVGRPWWWLLLCFVPLVDIVIAIMLTVDLAKSFGKVAMYAVGLILLPIVFYPMLGFGSSTYKGPSAA